MRCQNCRTEKGLLVDANLHRRHFEQLGAPVHRFGPSSSGRPCSSISWREGHGFEPQNNRFRNGVDRRQTRSYDDAMKSVRWDHEKNAWLQENRGVGFEQIVILMERQDVLEIVDHPNQDKYPGQRILTVRIGDYACLVPYVEDSDGIFLKTIIPSRKATRKYVGEEE